MLRAGTVVALLLLDAALAKCPPEGFDSIQNFNLATFVTKPWYIQQQAETSYLPKEQNYCVSAEYAILGKKTLLGYDVKVHNIAYDKTGKIFDSKDLIYAKIVDANTGKLEVAPYFLPPILSGAYWVIDYDESEGYALISGGPPKLDGQNGLCRTGTGVNGAGLWIFTRQQTRNEDLVQKVRGIATTKGFDLTVLNDVNQTSCPALVDRIALMV
jgi:lipocalin